MAYVDFKTMRVLLLNGFEAAALVNDKLGDERFGECDFGDAVQYGIDNFMFAPLVGDRFKYWNITPVYNDHEYTVEGLRSESQSLYFVDITKKMPEMFDYDWAKHRMYYLHYVFNY